MIEKSTANVFERVTRKIGREMTWQLGLSGLYYRQIERRKVWKCGKIGKRGDTRSGEWLDGKRPV